MDYRIRGCSVTGMATMTMAITTFLDKLWPQVALAKVLFALSDA